MLIKNQIYTATITDYTIQGQGIAHRVNRACPQSKLCGGCAFQHMDYQEECRLKAERVRQALNRLGGEALEAMDLLPAPETRGYRNKAQYPVA